MKILLIFAVLIAVNFIPLVFSINKKTEP